MLLNALDFPDLQSALSKADHGDRVYAPGVKAWQAPVGGFKITRGIELFGDGPGSVDSWGGTTLVPADGTAPDRDVLVIEPESNLQCLVIRDLKIRNRQVMIQAVDGRHGIHCNVSLGRRIASMRLERVTVLNMVESGIWIEALDLVSNYIGSLVIVACAAGICGGVGLTMRNVRLARVTRSVFNENAKGGVLCDLCGVVLYNPSLDQNGADPASLQGQVQLSSCHIANIDAGHFENFQGKTVAIASEFKNCRGASGIRGSYFQIPSAGLGPSTGIRVGAGSGAVAILPNRMTRVIPPPPPSSAASMVDVDATATGCTLAPQFDDLGGQAVAGRIGVPPSPNAGLLAAPLIRRPATADSLAGLIIPSGPTDPADPVQDGALFYNTGSNTLRARVAGAWKNVTIP